MSVMDSLMVSMPSSCFSVSNRFFSKDHWNTIPIPFNCLLVSGWEIVKQSCSQPTVARDRNFAEKTDWWHIHLNVTHIWCHCSKPSKGAILIIICLHIASHGLIHRFTCIIIITNAYIVCVLLLMKLSSYISKHIINS